MILASRLALLAVVGATPGLAIAGVVERPYSIVVAVVASILGVAAFIALDRLAGRISASRRVATAAVVGLGALAGLVLAFVLTAALGDRGAGDRTDLGVVGSTVDAVTHGWSEIITSPVPTDASARVMVPIALLVFAASGAAALASRRGSESRGATVGALLPGMSALVLTVVAAGREQYRPVGTGLLVALAAAGYLATYRPPRAAGARRFSRSQRANTAGGLARDITIALLIATVCGAIFGPAIAFGRDDDPFDPRDQVAPPTVPSGAVSPLDMFASRQQDPDQPMFTVRSDQPVLTRLVALETFDGARWTTVAAYEPTGTGITPVERVGIETRRVEAELTVTGLTGAWVPSVGDPIRVVGVDVLIDRASGSLIAADGDVTADTYRVSSDVPVADVAVLQALPAAADAIEARTLPPGLPPALNEMARVATAGATTPFINAVKLQRYLQLNFELDENFTAGQSYGHVLRALTEAGAGTDEQFASAFAVLGRVVGLPTRVVVGFAPGEQQPDGSYDVRSRHARVWPEVKFDGVGWIAFDPTPPRNGEASDEVPVGLGGGQGFVIEEAAPLSLGAGDAPPPLPAPVPVPAGQATPPWAWALIGLGALAVFAVVCVIATLWLKRSRTAARRSAADARSQVVGAWTDVLERLVEFGVEAPGQRTIEELVDDGGQIAAPLTGLFRPVSRALYDDQAMSESDAEQAWRARDRFVRATRRSAPLHRRAAWAVDPRPLFGSGVLERRHDGRRATSSRSRRDHRRDGVKQ